MSVSLPLNGSGKPEDSREVFVNEQGLGSEQISVLWNEEQVKLFRDALYLPTAHDFDSELSSPVSVEIDGWDSVVESDETDNTFVFAP